MGYSSKEVLKILHDDGWYEVDKEEPKISRKPLIFQY